MWLEFYPSLQDVIEKGQEQPNLTVGIVVAVVVVIVSVFLRLIFGGKKKPVSGETILFSPELLGHSYYVDLWNPVCVVVQTRVEKTNPEPAETASSQGSGENEENKEKEESSAPARRKPTRRDNWNDWNLTQTGAAIKEHYRT